MRTKNLLLLIPFLIGITTTVSEAANYYWLSTRYDNNWFDGRNWSNTSSSGPAIGNTNYYAGGAYPGGSDDVFIDASTSGQVNFGSQGITMKSMTWSGTANATSELYGYGSMFVGGNLTFVPNMKMNASYISVLGSVVTTAGNDMKDCNLLMYGGGTSSLNDNYYSSTAYGKVTIGGVFNTNNHNITVNTVAIANSDATFNMGSSTITCYDFNMNYSGTILTINPGTSLVKFVNYFVGMNKTYYDVMKTGNSGMNDAILGFQTFNNLTVNPGVTCLFGSGSNQTINGTLTVNGTSGSHVVLGPYGGGTYTLTKASGNVNADYADITANTATGGANFTTTNSTKTNCHGWDRVTTAITFADASKTYGNSSFSMTSSSASTGSYTYSITAGGSYASINASSGLVTILGAGTVTVQAQQAADVDYLSNSTTATLTISKAALTVTGANASKTYGAANPSFSVNYSGFAYSETSSALTTQPTATCSATTATGVGTYNIVPSGGSSSNYTFSYANGTLTINKAPITVNVNNASKIYGAANPTFSYSYSGFVNGEDASAFTLAFSTPTTTATAASPVGTYTINAAGGNVGPNYTVSAGAGGAINSGTLTINPATLTVTANDASKTYGAANPSFSVNYSGFVNGETAANLTTAPTATSSATTATVVGTASIVPSGGVSSNYNFSYVNGTLTINKAVLTATANNASKTYGAANPAFSVNYSGFVNSETSSVLTSQSTATSSATTASGAGTYNIVPSGGTAGNYSFTYVNGTLTVNKAPITVKVNDASRSYGAVDPAFSYSYSGFVNGDNASAFSIAFSSPVTTASANSPVGTYAINAAGGNVGPNYTVSAGGSITAGTLTVTTATLTVTANDASKTYGAVNPAFSVNYSGFKNGETASVLTTTPNATSSATTTTPVGTVSIVPSGGSATNYTLNYANGTLTINKAVLTATANNASKTYGAANPAFSVNYSGFVNGETSSVITSQSTASTSATTASGAGTYNIVPSGGTASNYSFAYVNGTLTVNKAPLTIKVADASRNYGAANPSFSYSFSGFVNGDDASAFSIAFSTPTTSATATSQVGTYTITPVGGNVGPNYSVNGFVGSGTLTVNPAALTVTANNASKIYGAANPAFSVNYSGFVNGETAANLTTAPTATSTATVSTSVGTVSIVPSGGAATNYSFNYVNGTLTINKATLTVTANDANRIYGAANPAFVVSYSGFVNGETAASLTSAPTATCAAIATTPAGTVNIIPSGGSSINYNFTFVNGTLTISKANQTITFNTLAPIGLNSPPVTLAATSSSGLPVSYSSSDNSIATINGNTLTVVAMGTCNITATQAGDGNYNSATPVVQPLIVKQGQTITFAALPVKSVSDVPFTLSATASSGLAVTYASSNLQVATINGNTVTIVGIGTTNITASQSGNGPFAPALDVVQPLTVVSKIISLSGTSVVADTLNMGTQIIMGLNATKKFTITNSGTGTLNLSAINYPSGFSGDKSSGSIAAGGSLDINVTFTPGAVGKITGAITFTSDASSGYNHIIAKATVVAVTAIEASASSFSVYPNPGKGIFFIEGVDAGNPENTSAEIIDATGRSHGKFNLTAYRNNTLSLDITSLNSGLYLIRVRDKGVVRVIKND
ncbi:hypothetical protein WSM22_25260 [Cytophagales bacterium WSM2-2]|nr:hypothetical protein WSM22_25260 [Cytophagales bacterium WSM2-2]